MYTYSLPIKEDDLTLLNVSAAASSDKKTKDDLIKELADLDEKFKNDPLLFDVSMPENLGLTQMEYNALSDEEIEALSKSQTQAMYNDEKTKLENELKKLTLDFINQKESIKNSAQEISKSIEDIYAERKSEAEKDALKRGLARSSIITGKIEAFDQNRVNDKIKLETDTVNSINKIDQTILALESEKDLALENFNITLAAELLKKINALKTERAEKVNEALKYNNTIAEKEAQYQKDKTESLFSMEQRRKDDVTNAKLLDYLYSEKAKIVKAYYDTMPPQEALRQIGEDSSLKEHLGGYYNYIVQYFKSKK